MVEINPKDRPTWDYDPASVERQLKAEFQQALYGPEPRVPAAWQAPRVSGGADVLALRDSVGREDVMRALAGTGDKRSKAWANARKQLSSYGRGARGGRPTEEQRQRLQDLADRAEARSRSQADAIKRQRRRDREASRRKARSSGSVEVYCDLKAWISNRERWINVKSRMSGAQKSRFVDYVIAGKIGPALALAIDNYGSEGPELRHAIGVIERVPTHDVHIRL